MKKKKKRRRRGRKNSLEFPATNEKLILQRERETNWTKYESGLTPLYSRHTIAYTSIMGYKYSVDSIIPQDL